MLHEIAGARHGGCGERRQRRSPPCRWALGLAGVAVLALMACSETSLNEAPVIDLSSHAGARSKPLPSVPAPADATYTVQKGDTFFHLAAVAHTSMHELAQWNGIDEHAPLVVGQRLRLQPPANAAVSAPAVTDNPPANADGAAPTEAVATPIPLGSGGGIEMRALDTPTAPAPLPPVSGAQESAAVTAGSLAPDASPGPAAPAPAPGLAPGVNPAGVATTGAPPVSEPTVVPDPSRAAPAVGSASLPAQPSAAAMAWVWPASGEVTGKFDPVRTKGIEIAAPEDSPIVAVADGTVSYTGSPRDYGNLVILKHGDELLSVYAHAKTILVKEGQSVRRGQTIATAGKSGAVPATVHFEARRNHVAVDPLELLPLR
jgi:lipoprotein NlpD